MTGVVALRVPRWVPDENLPQAIMSGRLSLQDVPKADRAWAVAILIHQKVTCEDIAKALGCSKRLVQHMKAEPMAVVVTELLMAKESFAELQRKVKVNSSAEVVTQMVHTIDRLTEARERLIIELSRTRAKCDKPCPDTIIVAYPRRYKKPKVSDQALHLF